MKRISDSVPRRRIPIQRPVQLLAMHGNPKFHRALTETYQLVKAEHTVTPKGEVVEFKPVPDRQVAYQSLVIKYIKYVKCFQVLCDSYTWLIHPQKRALLKRCIEAVAGRICELKYEMIGLEQSLFNYFDDILMDLGLTPDDMRLTLPKYFMAQRYKVLQMRERLLHVMIERMKLMEDPQLEDIVCNVMASPIPTGDAMNSPSEQDHHGRSSQCISTGVILAPVRPSPICKPRQIPGHQLDVPSIFVQCLMERFSSNLKIQASIRLIQSRWRGWLCRRRLQKMKEDEEIALNMRPPRQFSDMDQKEEADFHTRDSMWKDRDRELQVSKAIEHERFMAAHGHNIAWELKYNITQWLLELRDLLGSFPDYPTEEEGGCERLFALKTTEQVEQEIKEYLNPTPAAQISKDKMGSARRKEEIMPEGWKPGVTMAVPKLMDALEEYNNFWNLKEEADNVDQKFDRQLMLEQVREESAKQIRLQVDELMRYELDKLRCGIEDIAMPERRLKAAKEEKTKERPTKDPLANRTVEELYGQLVLDGIVVPVKKVRLDDILGDYNLVTRAQTACIPTIADIKSLLHHLVVFPMSSEFLHSMLPLTNRLLFAGPSGVGKSAMVHALCREIGANLFDLSPTVLTGKYMGGEMQEYLMNALLKVGKSMEPTIFYVDDCEDMFKKGNIPGLERPQRWAGVLSRMMAKIKKGDRMMLIGETADPFTCFNPGLFDLFRNVIYFPLPDYGSRVVIWKELLDRQPICRAGTILSPSLLAQFSDGYTGCDIERTIQETLTENRLSNFKPVENKELLMTLTLDPRSDPLYENDVSKWVTWYLTTPHMRRRRVMLEEEFRKLEAG